MKKEITVTIATLGFISSSIGIHTVVTSEDYVHGIAGETPLVMNFESEFSQDIIETQKIKTLSFSIDCRTNLDEYKAYLTQGQLYYYSFGEMTHRNFADLVAVDEPEYKDVQCCESVCTEIKIGTDEKPLDMDIDKDVTLYWTWITPEKLSMYELSVETTDGTYYQICSDDFYTIEISEEMKENKEQICSSSFLFNGDYCITSPYGWDNDRWHEGLDIVPYEDDTIYSLTSGYVEYAGWENPNDTSQGFGIYAKIVSDTDAYWYYYGHMDDIYVSVGEYVKKGQAIGLCGNTGSSTGKHTHLSIRNEYGDYNPAEIIGIENDYGDYEQVVNTDDLAIKCLSLNKHFEVGSLGFTGLNPNDSGALSLGILQWRGTNARDMLKYVYDNAQNEYTTLANKYDSTYIDMINYSDDWWENHTITKDNLEYNFYRELFTTDWGTKLQWEYGINYEKKIIQDAMENGITDEHTIILFSRSYNYHPYGGATKIMRNNGINDFETACSHAMEDRYFLKAQETIDMIRNETYQICSLESIRKEI